MITLTPLIDSFSVSFAPSTELDVAYYKVHAVHLSDLVNGDFTPSASNLINQGPETSFVWKTKRGSTTPYNGTWYVKVAAVDTFGEDALNYSSLYSVEVPDFTVLPDQLATTLRVDFWVNSSIFTFNLTAPLDTLSWSAGTIVRGEHTYTLAAGSLAGAGASYLVATLNDTGYVASLSTLPLLSGAPTLTDAQVVIGTTSDQAMSGGTYVAYMRQANSVLYEGAAIRDLTVTNEKVKDLSADKLTAGTIDANNVTIENLEVGTNVTMGPNAVISWTGVTGENKPADNATANNFRGEWSPASVTYAKGDEVLLAGSTWGCSVAHVSSAGSVPPTLPTTSNTYWALRAASGDSAILYRIATSSPVIVKDAQDAGTSGEHTNITVTGTKIVGGTSETYGFLTVTGNGDSEEATATAGSITTSIADNATYSSYDVKLYNQATVNGATLLDSQTVPVVYKGAAGASGANGTRTAILEMYKWAAAQPTSSFPSGTSTYTWATGEFTAPGTPNGWSIIPAAPVEGQSLWVCRTLYSDQLTAATTNITWSATVATSAAAAGIDGENGTRTAYLEVYQWALATPTLFPSGTSTYTWETGAFLAPGTANGWTITPAEPVPGYTLYACAMAYADKQTTTTSVVTWGTSTAYVVGVAGEDGDDGSNALTVVLSNEAHSVPCSASGTPSTYTSSGTDIIVYEGATALEYVTALTGGSQFTVSAVASGITCGAISAGTGKAVVANHSAMTTNPATVTYTITARRADGTEAVLTKVQTLSKAITGATGAAGSNAVTVVLSNEAHSIPCSADGAPTSYTGSGTDIVVYEGTTAFSYVTSITANNQFTVSAAASGITCGTISAGTGKAVVAEHLAMAANPATVTYTITARKSNATTVTFTKVQALSKSVAGVDGEAGPLIALAASKQAFTFTDNVLDAGQADIAFTVSKQNSAETVTWLSVPADLVSGTGDSKTLSAATFASNTQVAVSISTPSGLTDTLTVVRLNKSTAAAGATVGAPTGTFVGTALAETLVSDTATAKSNAASALTSIADIAADSKLAPVEKSRVRQDWDTIYSEKSALDTQATSLGITTEKTALGTAYTALGNYLNAGVAYTPSATPPSWITDANLSATTTIVGATFRSTFKAYYDAKIALLNKMSAVAATKADWANIASKPTVYTQAQIEGFATTITNNTVTTAFVNALNVTANSVNSAWVYAGTLTAAQVNATGFTANNANIGAYIASTDYNGSATDPFGTPGTAGWCISKSGGAAFNNVKVRGDIEATSIVADIVDTNHLKVNSVTINTFVETSSSVTVPNTGAVVTLQSISVQVTEANKPILLVGTCMGDPVNLYTSISELKLYRSGATDPISTKTTELINGVTQRLQISCVDAPRAAGSYTYTLKAVCKSSYEFSASSRTLFITEVLR